MSSIARSIAAAILLLPLFALAHASDVETRDAEFLSAGQQASVHAIDSTLVEMPLSPWLQRLVGPRATLSWEVNDCGEACGCPADTARDLPTCVEASSRLPDGSTLDVAVLMGTIATGLAGPPELHWAQVAKGDSTKSFRSLSDLRRYVNRGPR